MTFGGHAVLVPTLAKPLLPVKVPEVLAEVSLTLVAMVTHQRSRMMRFRTLPVLTVSADVHWLIPEQQICRITAGEMFPHQKPLTGTCCLQETGEPQGSLVQTK